MWLIATATALAVAWAWGGALQNAPFGTQVLAGSLASVLTAHALLPRPSHRAWLAALGVWAWGVSVCSGVLVVVTFAISGSPVAPFLPLLRLAFGAGVTVFLLFGLEECLTPPARSPALSVPSVWLLLGFVSTAPIWLGPAAEAHSSSTFLTDLSLAVSPLSYLSSLANYDYLRTPWFYRHCPLGALRYEYASPVWISLVYILLGTLGTLVARHRQRPKTRGDGSL